jgi:hypothetical protein
MNASKSKVKLSLSLLLLLVGALAMPSKASALNDQNNFCPLPAQMGVINLPQDECSVPNQFVNLWFEYYHLKTLPTIGWYGWWPTIVEPAHELGAVFYFFDFDFSDGLGLAEQAFHLGTVTDLDSDNYQEQYYLPEELSTPLTSGFDITNNPAGWRFQGNNGQTQLDATIDNTSGANTYEFHLFSETLKDPVPQWNDGFIDFGFSALFNEERGTQKLYSRTRNSISGTVKINGHLQHVIPVTSKGWFEKQWGKYKYVSGKWNGIQLSDGTEFTVVQYLDSVTGEPIATLGTFNNSPIWCSNTQLSEEDIVIQYNFDDPSYVAHGKSFPSSVVIEIPSEDLSVIIEPTTFQPLDSVVLLGLPPAAQAASRVSGYHNGVPVTGFGYSEYSDTY